MFRMKEFTCRATFETLCLLLGNSCREIIQLLSDAFHGTLGSYLCDALHEGRADAIVACLHEFVILGVKRVCVWGGVYYHFPCDFHCFFLVRFVLNPRCHQQPDGSTVVQASHVEIALNVPLLS
jgi:hypothetical protein